MGLFDNPLGAISSVGQSIGNAVSGGASDAFSSIGSFASKGLGAIGSFYGFDSNGKWTNSGGAFKWLDEGVGELTGRNQSRASLNLARDQFSYAQQQANNLISQQNWNRQQSDLMSSNSAGAARATESARSGINYGNATPLSMGPGFSGTPASKDFLGL